MTANWPAQPVPVALVITELEIGGAERAVAALATGLDRRRWEPTVLSLAPEGPLAEPLRAAGLEVRCLDVDRRRPVQAVLRLASALRARAPRIVQSFLFHANLVAKLAAPLAGVPWVVCGVRVAERRPRKRWHLLLDRLTARLATGSVCVSSGVMRYSRDVGRLPSGRLIVIPNGIDPTPFDAAPPADRAASGVSADAFLTLFVGRLEPQKGLPTLLDAAERVVSSHPEMDWHLALAGEGPDRSALERHARRTPRLAGRVHWLGRRGDVPALLKAADLFVLPSLWEGMPNVVLEAMAARRAVVATEVEGSEDLVVPHRTGWLVPPGQVEPLANALVNAATDRDRLRRYGEAGRARVEAEFGLERMVAAYDRLWTRVLGLPTPPE